ncbi:MAG TPA: sigma-70 family RNA polymerase sigma factor [Bryobacteraceae bacterium]|jgi:RNA polymerase sigma factor (sigma-70 family)
MRAFIRDSKSVEGFENDEVLVRECLLGDEKAWSALLAKYANLIFSIPVKRGFSQDDAADIFQAVCLTVLSELSTLRRPKALAGWLIQLTAHTCTRWKNRERRYVDSEPDEQTMAASDLPNEIVQQLEREQMVRAAVNEMSAECRQLINLLFFANPPVRYEAAAAALGLAKGSMGATRMRCLEKLRQSLEAKGFA